MQGAGLLTADQRATREAAREFAHGEVLPLANGYFGILIPQELAGLGLGYVEYCLVAEELARAWISNTLLGKTNH